MPHTEIPAMPCTATSPVNLPTVALISGDGALPPSLTPFAPRRVGRDLSVVDTDDEVVILYGCGRADDITALRRMFGRRLPGVLMVSPELDRDDVVEAFDNGATGYLIVGEVPEFCMVDAAVRTAEGQSIMSPSVIMVLMSHLRDMSPAPISDLSPVALSSVAEPQIDVTGELTPRECQVMELLVSGHTIAEIAGHLRLTSKTVRNNLSNIYAKLQVRRQSEAILLWLGHQQHRPGVPKNYNEPRYVPQLSPLRHYAPQAL
jgi:DNA-binding NarL/FixJ family response regulator